MRTVGEPTAHDMQAWAPTRARVQPLLGGDLHSDCGITHSVDPHPRDPLLAALANGGGREFRGPCIPGRGGQKHGPIHRPGVRQSAGRLGALHRHAVRFNADCLLAGLGQRTVMRRTGRT
jgi:hypothetical protein